MIASLKSVRTNPAQQTLHTRFLAIAPRIELHGRIFFRHVKCPHKRADFIADMIALSWKWFLQLAQRGKDASHFPTALACYAARAVKSGRRVNGMEAHPRCTVSARSAASSFPRQHSARLPDTLHQSLCRGPDRQHAVAGAGPGCLPLRLPRLVDLAGCSQPPGRPGYGARSQDAGSGRNLWHQRRPHQPAPLSVLLRLATLHRRTSPNGCGKPCWPCLIFPPRPAEPSISPLWHPTAACFMPLSETHPIAFPWILSLTQRH